MEQSFAGKSKLALTDSFEIRLFFLIKKDNKVKLQCS